LIGCQTAGAPPVAGLKGQVSRCELEEMLAAWKQHTPVIQALALVKTIDRHVKHWALSLPHGNTSSCAGD